MASNENDIILDYHDSIIRASDLSLLENQNWLNDIIISFYYEYLEREKFRGECQLAFVNASSVQCIKLCQDVNEANVCFLEPLELNKRQFVFFPLNNNSNSRKSGGSHWSLLVYSKAEASFFHFDSAQQMNESEASFFFNKVKSYFDAFKLVSVKTYAKQSNSYDCGVYVLAGTEFIADYLSKHKKLPTSFDQLTSEHISQFRLKIKQLILSLNKN